VLQALLPWRAATRTGKEDGGGAAGGAGAVPVPGTPTHGPGKARAPRRTLKRLRWAALPDRGPALKTA